MPVTSTSAAIGAAAPVAAVRSVPMVRAREGSSAGQTVVTPPDAGAMVFRRAALL